jgi:hypothetical protein
VGGMAGRSAGIGRWWRGWLRCRPLFSGRRIVVVVGLRQPLIVVALGVVVRLFFSTPQDFIHLLHLSLPLSPHGPDGVALNVVV